MQQMKVPVTEDERAALDAIARATHMPMSVHIRAAVDEYLHATRGRGELPDVAPLLQEAGEPMQTVRVLFPLALRRRLREAKQRTGVPIGAYLRLAMRSYVVRAQEQAGGR